MTTFEARSTWTTQKIKPPAQNGSRKGSAMHYPAFGDKPLNDQSHAKCREQVKSIEKMHLANKEQGYVAIAYNLIACPHDVVIEGRGVKAQSGANGTSTSNAQYGSVLLLVGNKEVPSAKTKAAAIHAHKLLGGSGKKKHKDFVSTSCPGAAVSAWVDKGMPPVGGTAPKPPAKPPASGGTKYPLKANEAYGIKPHDGFNGNKTDQKNIQKIQKKVKSPADGFYGGGTKAAVKKYQAANKLTADGLTGPATWKKMGL